MSDIRAGRLIRELRRRRGLRQRDVAVIAGVSQQTVSLVERGRLDDLSVAKVRAVGRCLDVDLPFEARYRGALGDRLLDSRHAALAEEVASRLRDGWEVIAEYGFNHFGERGSVDLLAWHARLRALLIVEIKSELADIQETLRSLDRKRRIVPGCVASERSWRADQVAVVVVLPATSTAHTSVARHEALFAASLPARTVDVRRWVAAPQGDLRGLWFVQATNTTGSKSQRPSPHRVRRVADVGLEVEPRSKKGREGRGGRSERAERRRNAT